jgi:hypothetical protein
MLFVRAFHLEFTETFLLSWPQRQHKLLLLCQCRLIMTLAANLVEKSIVCSIFFTFFFLMYNLYLNGISLCPIIME